MIDLPQDDRPYSVRLAEAVSRVAPEQVKTIESMMKGKVEGVRTVGDIAKAMDMELMIVATVIKNNIVTEEVHRFRDGWK